MGLFSFMKRNSENVVFITQSELEGNYKRLVDFVPVFVNELQNLGITSEKALKLEYFFYTNTKEKAERLSNEIKNLNYSVKFGKSSGDKKQYVITGWSSKIQISQDILSAWAKEMCDLGYKYDCDFDGWGADPTDL